MKGTSTGRDRMQVVFTPFLVQEKGILNGDPVSIEMENIPTWSFFPISLVCLNCGRLWCDGLTLPSMWLWNLALDMANSRSALTRSWDIVSGSGQRFKPVSNLIGFPCGSKIVMTMSIFKGPLRIAKCFVL